MEHDFTTYGEEVKFGDGMGQNQVSRAGGDMDTVTTNALVRDALGIFKADIGFRDGRVAGIGKAGNPATQPGLTIIIGPGTEIITGEGRTVTAGGMDAHIHVIAPGQIEDALQSGITTLLEVRAAEAPVVRAQGNRLARMAWHIGNRHTPCQVEADNLVIRQDPVLKAMRRHFGATLTGVITPFRPEGGAYGHGRTLGHDDGPHGLPHGQCGNRRSAAAGAGSVTGVRGLVLSRIRRGWNGPSRKAA